MGYALLTIIVATLVLTFVTSYVILRAAVHDAAIRKLLLFFVVLTPFVSVFALVKALFSPTKPIKYSVELGAIEDRIEEERASTFGEKILHPSFSQRWKESYLYAVEKSALAAAKLDPSFNTSVFSIHHIR